MVREFVYACPKRFEAAITNERKFLENNVQNFIRITNKELI